MLFGCLFRHKKHEYLRDRLAIRRFERKRLRRPDERGHRLLEPLDPSVRYCNTWPQSGRPQALAREEAVEDERAGDLCVVLEQLADLFEQTLLAGRVDVEGDVRFGQQ